MTLTFEDPYKDYQWETVYSDALQRALKSDSDLEENAVDRREAFNAHCIQAIVQSDRIDLLWVKYLTIRYVDTKRPQKTINAKTTLNCSSKKFTGAFGYSKARFEGSGDFSRRLCKRLHFARISKKKPSRSKGRPFTVTDEDTNSSILMLPARFPKLLRLEVPVLVYETADALERARLNQGSIYAVGLKWQSPIERWFLRWPQDISHKCNSHWASNLNLLVLQSLGDDISLEDIEEVGGQLGKDAEQKWVEMFGAKSKLVEIVVKNKCPSAWDSVWVTRFGARSKEGYSELQGNCHGESRIGLRGHCCDEDLDQRHAGSVVAEEDSDFEDSDGEDSDGEDVDDYELLKCDDDVMIPLLPDEFYLEHERRISGSMESASTSSATP